MFQERTDPGATGFSTENGPMFEPGSLGLRGGIGGIDMELLSVIRRWHYRDHYSIRAYLGARASRNTVAKYLRSDSVEPKFMTTRSCKLGAPTPASCRRGCGRRRGSRQQKRRSAMHADVLVRRETAHTIAWPHSLATGRPRERNKKQVRPRRVRAAGVLCRAKHSQFDWSEDWAVIGGEGTKLQVAHVKLSYSRAFILRAYPQQTHEMLFDAHNHAFRVLGGVPRRGIYDNMRTAVDKIGRGKERQVNARFSAMVSHFLFEAGVLQSGVRLGEGADREERPGRPPSALAGRAPSFPSLAALNDWLETRCRELWAQTLHGSHPGAIADALGRRGPASDAAFAAAVRRLCRIRQARLADVPGPSGRHCYSVPTSFANRPVSVRVYPERIVAAEGQVICEHRRVFARSHQRKSTTTAYDWRHYLAVIQRKPGALRNGAPFAELPPAFRALQQRMLKTPGGDREMVEILPWFSSMTNRPCSPPSNWRWRPARRRRPYPEPASSPGRRQADGHASGQGAAGSDVDHRAASQRRAHDALRKAGKPRHAS